MIINTNPPKKGEFMLLNNNNKNDELSQLVYQIQHIQKDIQSIKSALIDNKHVSRDRYTIRQVAETAGCSVETIKNHVRNGYLKVRYPMAKKRFHADDVEAYLRGKS